jgi:uncharacterized surface protein with fasciclin (FAS1) repeats
MSYDKVVKRMTASALVLTFGATGALAQQSGTDSAGQSGSQYGSSSSQSQPGSSSSGSPYGGASSAGQGQTEQQSSQSAQDRMGQSEAEQSARGASSASSAGEQGSGEQLSQLAEEHDDISQFVEALQQVGLADALMAGTNYTVFAPTNDAFEELPNAEELMQPENREQLISTLRAHIVADDLDPERARSLGAAQTVDGGTVQIAGEGEELRIGEATVVNSDIEQVGNLRVYAIDQVLESNAGSSAASSAADSEREDATTAERDASQQGETGGASRSSGF